MQKRNISNFLNVLTIVVNHNSQTATLVTDPVVNINLMLYYIFNDLHLFLRFCMFVRISSNC